MQIVIPMSGFGERFRKVGYKKPKPLIVVDGKTIIQHIVEMFPDENDITFICNKDHLNEPEYNMQEILKEIAPESTIIGINPHKLGPVYAVLQVLDQLDLKKPTIVNYADFTCDWNYADFCNIVESTKCDGAIPCYKGFHPHTLWSNYYAYVPEKEMRALDIQEKKPFTDSPREEFASSGTYYFKSANLMRRYFERCITENLTVGGEYYVSMVYKPMIQDGLNIQVYELNHFMQWGTPTDLEEYCYWSKTFSSILDEKEPPKHNGTLILPMVGLGSRFQKEGFKTPKPLIKVSGKAMAVQALMDLPQTKRQKFVLRKDMPKLNQLIKTLKEKSPNAEFSILDYMTDGQASTCIEGSLGLEGDKPVTIAACDNGMLYNSSKFQSLMDSENIDIIVWGARGYPGARRSPEMYGWIDVGETGLIKRISVKKPLSNPTIDPIVVGTFTFKKLEYFINSYHSMKGRGAKINGEYYVDMLINDAIALGLRCVVFEIDYYICWGTPDDLRTFQYWQSCFNGWPSHPYQLEKDRNALIKIQ
jgi:NDP-sugar pyrophosphorylase family protein